MNHVHLANRLKKITVTEDGTNLVHQAAEEYFEQSDIARALDHTPTKDYPYISDAETECDRQIVYSLMNVPKTDPPDLQSRMNMETGKRVEQMVGDYFEAADYKPITQTRVEIPTESGTVVVGKPDFLLTDENQTHLVEVKKVKVYAIKDSVLANGPASDERGVKQGNLYVHAARLGLFGEEYKNINRLLLVWALTEAVKGEPGLFAWWRKYDPDLAHHDLARLSKLQQLANDSHLPKPPPSQNLGKRWKYTWGSFPCAWCSWREQCYKDEPEGRKGSNVSVKAT